MKDRQHNGNRNQTLDLFAVTIRAMRRDELDVLVDWAAAEGWNPGLHDANVFWATDPEGFVAAELDGELVGGGSIVCYDRTFGFMGFFIVRPDWRGRGLGNHLWRERLRRIRLRLDASGVVGMDGVFDMQPYYASGGFRFAGRDLRFAGRGRERQFPEGLVPVTEIPFADLDAYDRAHFPASRTYFLERWLRMPDSHALAALHDGQLAGYGVLRPCREGYKVGPLFAAGIDTARDLLHGLTAHIPGETYYLDVPEDNRDAMQLAAEENMEEVFGCARMYFGPAPDLPLHEIFGVTTFELG